MTIAARYEHGVFKPMEDVQIAEGTVVEVHLPEEKRNQPVSIGDLGFATMWTDRDDIGDGLDYVNRLRDSPRS